jgi:hypothetical protein
VAEFCQGYLVRFMSRSIATHDTDRVFTSREVSCIAKISLRQLQWLDERKLISPRQRRAKTRLPSGTSNRKHGGRGASSEGAHSAEDAAGHALSAARDGAAITKASE